MFHALPSESSSSAIGPISLDSGYRALQPKEEIGMSEIGGPLYVPKNYEVRPNFGKCPILQTLVPLLHLLLTTPTTHLKP